MPSVNIPYVGVVEFPDTMSQDEISNVIKTQIMPNAPQASLANVAGSTKVADVLQKSIFSPIDAIMPGSNLVNEPTPAVGSLAKGIKSLSNIPTEWQLSSQLELIAANKRKYGENFENAPEKEKADILNTVKKASENLTYLAKAGEDVKAIEQKYGKDPLSKKIDALEQKPEFKNASEWEQAGMIGKEYLKNIDALPSYIANVGLSSLPQSIAMAVAARFGMAVGPTGGLIVGGGSSAMMEYGQQYVDLREQGFSHEEANNKAMVKSSIIGAFDAASLRSAGKIAEKIFDNTAKKVFKETAKEVGKEIPKQAALGAAGEGLGSYASNQPVNPRAVFEEAIGEVFGAPGEAAATYRSKKAEAEQAQPPKLPPNAPEIPPAGTLPNEPVAPVGGPNIAPPTPGLVEEGDLEEPAALIPPKQIIPPSTPPKGAEQEVIDPELKARASMRVDQLLEDAQTTGKLNIREMNKLARDLDIEPNKDPMKTATSILDKVREEETAPPKAPEAIPPIDMGENTEYRIVKNDNGWTAVLVDNDANQMVSATTFPTDKFGDEKGKEKAIEYAKNEQEKAKPYFTEEAANAPEEFQAPVAPEEKPEGVQVSEGPSLEQAQQAIDNLVEEKTQAQINQERQAAQREAAQGIAPAAAPTAPAAAPTTEAPAAALSPEDQAKKDFEDALAELAWMAGKDTRAMMMPENEQRLMPTLIKLFDAAFRQGYHTFKQAAKFVRNALRKALGAAADAINLNHLQGAYIAMSGNYPDKATPIAEVAGVKTIEEVEAEEVTAAEKPAGKFDLSTPDGKYKIAQEISQHFLFGNSFNTIIEARKFIADLTGQKIEAGTMEAKQADEAVEVGVVLAAKSIIRKDRKPSETYDGLVNLYNQQPNLAIRSSTSVREQAYSTPAPLAYIASQLAGIERNTSVYEPTAGNGMLLIGVDNDTEIQANELNTSRYEMLKRIYPGANITNRNAMDVIPYHYDSLIANPPFGVTGESFNVKYADFNTREIDHAIAMESLGKLGADPKYKAVLILGGVRAENEEGRREGYRSAAKRNFYSKLYKEFNVVDHFTVAGNLYSKQGASYPVDVIVIYGQGKSQRALPAADLPQIYSSYEQLKEKLNGPSLVSTGNVSPDRTNIGERTAGAGEPERLGERPVTEGGRPSNEGAKPAEGGRTGVSETEPNKRVRTEPAGAGVSGGQPGTTNEPERVNQQNAVPSAGKGKQPVSAASLRANEPSELGGPSVVTGERVESRLTDRRGEEAETGHQVAYKPHSEAASVGTLVPKAMEQSINQSLDRVEEEMGNIDEYVANAIQMDVETLKENLSAEQIDALALAIRNAEAGKGFIIGDQTGIGKGRVVAAMIKYAIVNDKVPIFVTQKATLYGAMVNDLDDIGMTKELALDTNNPKILMTNNDEKVPYKLVRKVNNKIEVKKLILKSPAVKLDEILKDMQSKDSIGNYKVIFTTYSQLNTVNKEDTERRRFVNHFAQGNYLILDESHTAGGSGEKQKEDEEKQKEGEGVNTAKFVRGLVDSAFGTFFSSATYAKRPDVMDLYSSTDMSLAVDNISELADAIKNGGIPMQQVVANMLTNVGQYIRRERTFKGVAYDTVETKVNKETAEKMATSMRDILAFSRAVQIITKQMQKTFDQSGASGRAKGEKTTVQSTTFGSKMHSLIGQMLLSLKTDDAVKFAIERIKAGEKPVITVSNTMGSFLAEYAKMNDLKAGDPINLSFKDMFLNYLEKQRTIKIKKPGEKKGTPYRLTDDDLGPVATATYNKIKDYINNAGFGAAPMSPIDYMHNALRQAGYTSDEITGRGLVINYQDGIPILATRRNETEDKDRAIEGFNDGTITALIINQSGSTGISLHASEKFADKSKRHMIIAQADPNIDVHMQTLGRVLRTGQVQPPVYSQLMADVPAEMRPAAVLLKKMASLNANTTASRKSAVTAEGVVDFMNDYGGQVAQEYLRDNPEVYEAIGGKEIIDLLDDPTKGTEEDIRKFTGYIPILPLKQQEEIYKDLIERYNDLLERENSMGTNKLEAKAVDLDAETLSSTPITEDKGDPSLFAQPAYMEQVEVKRTVKPYSKAEVEEQVKEHLAGTHAQYESQRKTALAKTAEFREELRERTQVFRTEQIAKLKETEADPIRIQKFEDDINANFNRIQTVLNNYPIGTPISLTNKQNMFVYGVVTNIENKKKTANPSAGSDWKMTIALANGEARSTNLNFSQIGSTYSIKEENIVNYFNPETQTTENIHLLDMFDKNTTVRREKRFMVTGNILAGYAAVKNIGQIMSYTKKGTDETGQGILMPRNYDFEKEQREAPIKLKTAENAMRFINEVNGTVTSADNVLRIFKNGNQYRFNVPGSKKEGGTYFLDNKLTNILGDFHGNRTSVTAATWSEEKVKAAIDYILEERGDTLIASSPRDKAKAMFQPKAVPQSNVSLAKAGYTEKRIRTILGSYADHDDHDTTRAYVVNISPTDFLKATTESVEEENNIIKKAGELNIPELVNEIQDIYLYAERQKNGSIKIVGHEGRHRMAALRAAGIKEVPVVVNFREWMRKAKPITEETYFTPQKYYDGTNARSGFFTSNEMIPISYDYKAELIDKFSGPNTSLLFNIGIKPSEKVSEGIKRIHEEKIKEYAKLRLRASHILRKVSKGEINLDLQRELTGLLEMSKELKADIKKTTPKNLTPEQFMKRALDEFTKGNISKEVLDVVKYVYNNTPSLLSGIKLSVRKAETLGTTGNFEPLQRLVTLYKGSGAESPGTIRHELMHSLEQMMSPETRQALVDVWQKALENAIKQNTDVLSQAYFNAVLNFIENPSAETFDAATKIMPSQDFYQYINPSEYWAVNAEKLMAAKMGTPWHRFVQFAKMLFEGLKSVVGFDSSYAVYKTFNDLIKGKTPRYHKLTLTDYITNGKVKIDFLNNVQDTDELLAKHGRNDAPIHMSNSVTDRLLGGFQEAKNIGAKLKESPRLAVNNMVGNVDRALLAIRINTIDFTAGLTAADAERYGRMLVDSAGRAIASVAMNQALKAARIGTQVIMMGKLVFDPNIQMFRAVKDKFSMANILTIKHQLEKRVGVQRTANVIQAYFEAKRSKSINQEYADRLSELEDLRSEQMDPGTSIERQLKLLQEVAEAEDNFRSITIALQKVNMTEEAIEDFIKLEKDYPELKEMMKNWNAVNQNMINMMEQSRIISKKRADTLRDIEDYVPWQRIQDEQSDPHTPIYGSKGVRNISREHRFKEGKVTADIDDIVDNMLHNVMTITRNSIKNYAANRIAVEYGVRNEKGKLKVFPKEDFSKGIVSILMNGRKVNIQIADPLIARAAIGIEHIQIPMNEILSFFSNALRRSITFSGVFQVKQLFMDAPTAALVSGVKNPVKLYGSVFGSFIKSLTPVAMKPVDYLMNKYTPLKTNLAKEDPIIQYLRSYGIGGYHSSARTAEHQYRQEIGLLNESTMSKAASILDRIADASDLAQRRAVFIRVMKETKGDTRAAVLAATNVIDFDKRGDGRAAQFFNRTIAFMNAYAQQIDVLAQALAEPVAYAVEKTTGAKVTSVSGKLRGLSREDAMKRLALAGGLLAMTCILYALLVGDDDEYKRMDDQTKMRNFVIPRRLMKNIGYDHTLLLPMHTSASYFFKSIPELLTYKMLKDGTKDAVDNTRLISALREGMVDALLGPLGSGPIPTGFKPIAEIGLNHNFFTGGNVTPEGMKNIEAFRQYTMSTSELGKWFSAASQIPYTGKTDSQGNPVEGSKTRILNPLEADHLMRGLAGSVAGIAMWGSNLFSGNRASQEERNNPLYGSFIAPEVPRGREDLFYDLKQRSETAMGTFKDLAVKQNPKEAKQWLEVNKGLIQAYGFTEGAGKALQGINANMRRISDDKQLTSEEKRKQLDEYKMKKDEILQDTIKFRFKAGL